MNYEETVRSMTLEQLHEMATQSAFVDVLKYTVATQEIARRRQITPPNEPGRTQSRRERAEAHHLRYWSAIFVEDGAVAETQEESK